MLLRLLSPDMYTMTVQLAWDAWRTPTGVSSELACGNKKIDENIRTMTTMT